MDEFCRVFHANCLLDISVAENLFSLSLWFFYTYVQTLLIDISSSI